MNCWIMLMHICAFSPDEIYVRADLSTQVSGAWPSYFDGKDVTHHTLGHLELGWRIDLTPRLTARVMMYHESYLYIHDRGQERVGLSVEWRPF